MYHLTEACPTILFITASTFSLPHLSLSLIISLHGTYNQHVYVVTSLFIVGSTAQPLPMSAIEGHRLCLLGH